MHGTHGDLLALFILLTVSFITPILSARLRAPAAVLLIAFGVAVGANGFAWVHPSTVVDFFAEFGFIVLMFLAGMEIDFNQIRSKGLGAVMVVAVICMAIFGLAFATCWVMGLQPIFGLALGATSVGMPLAVLKETGRIRTLLGQNVVLVGSVGEFLTLVGMTLFYFITRYGASVELVLGLGKLVAVLVIAGITLRVLMAWAWWKPTRFSSLVEVHEVSELGVRASLFLMVAFSLLAIVAGVESIVGSFLAGALIAFVLRGKEVLEEKLTVVGYGLFIPIFFISVGLHFDIKAVTLPNLLFASELLLATFFIRLLPCALLLRQGISVRDWLGTASLLSAPLTLVVAIAALGAGLEVLTPEEQGTLIVLAVASGVVFPIAFRIIVSGAPSKQPAQPADEHG